MDRTKLTVDLTSTPTFGHLFTDPALTQRVADVPTRLAPGTVSLYYRALLAAELSENTSTLPPAATPDPVTGLNVRILPINYTVTDEQGLSVTGSVTLRLTISQDCRPGYFMPDTGALPMHGMLAQLGWEMSSPVSGYQCSPALSTPTAPTPG